MLRPSLQKARHSTPETDKARLCAWGRNEKALSNKCFKIYSRQHTNSMLCMTHINVGNSIDNVDNCRRIKHQEGEHRNCGELQAGSQLATFSAQKIN